MTTTGGPFKPFLVLCISLILALQSSQVLASLQAQVDRNPITSNETFNLILQNDDGHGGDPDLSVLGRDFDILGQSKSSSVQIINGQTSQSTKWQISLIAKHNGHLQIPPISQGGQSSQAIDINVSEASQVPASQENRTLFVEVSAEPQTVHVQQQFVFTVRLYRAVNLGNGTLSDPAFPDMDAVIKGLGTDRNFQTVRQGTTYSVTERRYAVFPQKSGPFSSDPITFDGSVIDQNQNGGFFMFTPFSQASHRVRIRSNTVTLSVKPIPAAYAGGQWVPANNLQLVEQWSVNPPTFTVGEPITRTLIETASGLTSAQLPMLDAVTTADGFKIYPDQPQLKDGEDGNGMSGRREQKIAYIPTRPGTVTLPAMEIKWWNVKLDKEEVATLPARTFTVLPGKLESMPVPVVAGRMPDESVPVNSSNSVPDFAKSKSAGWWPWLSLFLGCGWCATLFAWWWRTRGRAGKVSHVSERALTLKSLEKRLEKNCKENDPVEAKTAMLALARRRWPQNPPVSLTAIAGRCNPELANALTELDRALYAGLETQWRGEELWKRYADQKPEPGPKATDNMPALAPLYFS